jgi:hypothetical protein
MFAPFKKPTKDLIGGLVMKLDINILYICSTKKHNLSIIFLKEEAINYYVDGKF